LLAAAHWLLSIDHFGLITPQTLASNCDQEDGLNRSELEENWDSDSDGPEGGGPVQVWGF